MKKHQPQSAAHDALGLCDVRGLQVQRLIFEAADSHSATAHRPHLPFPIACGGMRQPESDATITGPTEAAG